ncbi:MAG: hypothetical protein MJ252_28770 [archaeon]|nr:hypothetical protein [archaeon]
MSPVKNVKLKRDKIFVVCEQKIYIFAFSSFESIDNIDTYENSKGIIAISNDPDKSIIAYLDNNKLGSVKIKDLDTQKEITVQAHESMIAYMAMNPSGTILATCSEKGTLIRIFSTIDGKLLQELRRGSEKAEIYCLCFDPTERFLACSSDRKTIHIFTLNLPNQSETGEEPKNQQSVFGKLSSYLGMPKNYLNSEWSFAQFRINDIKSICTFGPDNSLIVVSSEGNYYQATFDPKTGGECTLVVQKNIFSHN